MSGFRPCSTKLLYLCRRYPFLWLLLSLCTYIPLPPCYKHTHTYIYIYIYVTRPSIHSFVLNHFFRNMCINIIFKSIDGLIMFKNGITDNYTKQKTSMSICKYPRPNQFDLKEREKKKHQHFIPNKLIAIRLKIVHHNT